MRYPGICQGTYAGKSLTPAGDRCKNLYPETLSGAGSPEAQKVLQGTPGTSLLVTLPTTPVQALFTEPATGLAFVVSGINAGPSLYFINVAAGTASASIGTIGGAPFAVSSNGVQTMISSLSGASAYIYDNRTTSVAPITSPGFLLTAGNAVLDNYFVNLVPNSRIIQISALMDGMTWDVLDQTTVEGGSENIVNIIADHGELWIFGSEHAEVWTDTGAANFPLERIKSIYITHGLAARQALVATDNTIFWLGKNKDGQCRVFKAEGYIAKGVSNRSVEYFFNMYAQTTGVSDAVMYSYQNETGHTFLVINFPSATADISATGGVTTGVVNGATWVYDITEDEWHERMRVVSNVETMSLAKFHTFASGKHLVGGGDGTANVYLMREDIYQDNGQPIKRVRRAPHITNGLKWITYHFLRLSAQVGVIANGAADYVINLRVSNDGGMTWTQNYAKSLGFLGEYKKEICWRQLGRAKRRAFEINTTVNAPVCIIDADLAVDGEQ